MSIRKMIAVLVFVSAAAFCPVSSGAGQRQDAEALAVLAMSLDSPRVPYEGEVSVVTRHGDRESVRRLLVTFSPPARYRREIVDRLGFPVLLIVSDGETEWVYDRRRGAAWRGEPADPDYKLLDPDEEYALLVENYVFRLTESERIAGRLCRVLEVRSRREDRVVRRLWVDREHGVVLQRAALRPDGTESSRISFARIRFPERVEDGVFAFHPPPRVRVEPSRLAPDYLDLEEAASATAMRPRLPKWLPPGYVFESVNLLAHKGATILHYRYSDGIDVLSLFQAPKRARLSFAASVAAEPARKVRLRAGTGRVALWPDGKILEWGADERFVLIGRVGLDALRRVADSIPERSALRGDRLTSAAPLEARPLKGAEETR
ncbi:MAG: sigma-E factor regulatory protein RseB domain-containing protein [Elusimicrobiota bacterium]